MTTTPPELVCRPIGYLRTGLELPTLRFLAPRQPDGQGQPSRIELVSGLHLDAACQDLQGFSRIWLLAWFHLNRGWRPKVNPPRDRRQRRGVLATRSPHRPNPLALTSVALLAVEPPFLWIGPHDLVEGTPILDIKPYLPEVDSHPHESTGWLTPLPSPQPLRISATARMQLDWLNLHYHPDFERRVVQVLGQDARPHRSRRIAHLPDGRRRLGCGPWRVWFQWSQVEGVQVLSVTSRYTPGQIPEDEPIHRHFSSLFAEAETSTNRSPIE